MTDLPNPLVVVMGVSGSGKTTVGEELAARLGVEYAEGDDFHPAANVAKMSAGIPLTDADRAPWLDLIAAWLAGHADRGGVVTCSALKHGYRDRLRTAAPHLFLLELEVPRDELLRRLNSRVGHFMPASLLDSQLAALEPLTADEIGASIDADRPPGDVVVEALAALGVTSR
ncbi:gluconokinase [Nocardia arthritidis]